MLKQVKQRRTDALSRVGWEEFEVLVADHYRALGFDAEHVGTAGTGRRFDGGIDLKLRRGDEFLIVQCKHWNARQVPHNPVHQLLGLLTTTRGATGAILITSGEFTPHALRSAAQNPAIQLIDGDAIRRLLGPLPPALLEEVSRDPLAPPASSGPPSLPPPLPGASPVRTMASRPAPRRAGRVPGPSVEPARSRADRAPASPARARRRRGTRRYGPIPAVAGVFVLFVVAWGATQWWPGTPDSVSGMSPAETIAPAGALPAGQRQREGRLAQAAHRASPDDRATAAALRDANGDPELVHLTPTNVWTQAELEEWKRRNAESMEIIRRTTPELP